ncbi:MAG: SPOR domain-containing protein [Bacteroidia bacterium]|nr:SPOR domain-containing protein [Bacteroidia bacterium]
MINKALNLILCFAATLMMASPVFGQKTDPKGKAVYYKYENENVEIFRDRVDFKLPEPNVIVKKKEEGSLSPDSLSAYFLSGNSLHIQAEEELSEWLRRDSIAKSKMVDVQGYRIQVYAGNNRKSAFNVKGGLITRFPDYATYLEYKAPNYVVRIGDFMEREDAILFQKIIRNSFPGAFIVPSKVKVPKYNPDWRNVFEEKSKVDSTLNKPLNGERN